MCRGTTSRLFTILTKGQSALSRQMWASLGDENNRSALRKWFMNVMMAAALEPTMAVVQRSEGSPATSTWSSRRHAHMRRAIERAADWQSERSPDQAARLIVVGLLLHETHLKRLLTNNCQLPIVDYARFESSASIVCQIENVNGT